MKMEKKVRIFGVEVILVDEDRVFVDEVGDGVRLSEELGWWEDAEDRIWIWAGRGAEGFIQRWGVGVHEFVEMVLVKRLKINRDVAHRVANIVEKILTLGRSKVF